MICGCNRLDKSVELMTEVIHVNGRQDMHKIFIGLLLVFLDFNLDLGTSRIGLIPDFLGYISILQGLKEMENKSVNFLKVIPVTKLALILSIVIYILDLAGLSLNPDNRILPVAFGIVMTIISLYISYYIVQGVLDLQQRTGFDLNGNKLYAAWKLVAVFSVLAYPLFFIPGLNIISIILTFVFYIYFLYYLNVTKNAYKEYSVNKIQ